MCIGSIPEDIKVDNKSRYSFPFTYTEAYFDLKFTCNNACVIRVQTGQSHILLQSDTKVWDTVKVLSKNLVFGGGVIIDWVTFLLNYFSMKNLPKMIIWWNWPSTSQHKLYFCNSSMNLIRWRVCCWLVPSQTRPRSGWRRSITQTPCCTIPASSFY